MKKIILATLIASLFTSPALFAGELVNINKADTATLDKLDGIGEKKAEAIIAYRTEHGDFKTTEDIKEVPGIGDKLFEKFKDSISLTDGINTATTTTIKTGKATENKVRADGKTEKSSKTMPDKAAKAKTLEKEPDSKADKS